MPTAILVTKLFIPPDRPEFVSRPRLIDRLNAGLNRKLTLISAPAGFGKTTLAAAWTAHLRTKAGGAGDRGYRTAWISLDGGDNEFSRFLEYLVAAINENITLDALFGRGTSGMLQSTQPLPPETILTQLLNEIAALPEKIILVLDDYHLIHALEIHEALVFLLENLPPQLHLVITTREDPLFPLARLRTRGQLTELRAADLRFTASEATEFFNQTMGLTLSSADVAALDARTEGWIAGLKLAALAFQGSLTSRGEGDTSRLIESFTGSHRLVLDYLIEEVLSQQSPTVQEFLLQTAILERLHGPLCDAVTGQSDGQATLEILDRSNLFIVPLDNERKWYRYHRLFADLLQARLHNSFSAYADAARTNIAELHIRASAWYEAQGMAGEAFRHAVAADDVARAARLAIGDGLPLHFRGVVTPLLEWLKSLPEETLDAQPALWAIYASVLIVAGQPTGIEEKLAAAETGLVGGDSDERMGDLIGLIASTRAALWAMALFGPPMSVQEKLEAAEADMRDRALDEVPDDLVGRIAPMQTPVAVAQEHLDMIINESKRALAYARPDNLIVRISSVWMLGVALHLRGNRVEAGQSYRDVISITQTLGDNPLNIAARIGLGQVQETENQLYLAANNYQGALELIGDLPLPVACEAYLGLGRISYEWNDLDSAENQGQNSLTVARQIKSDDRSIQSAIFLARLSLARRDITSAEGFLAEAEHLVRANNFVNLRPQLIAARTLALLHKGDLPAAADLARRYELPLSEARVKLSQRDPSAAISLLKPYRQQMSEKRWKDEELKTLVLCALGLDLDGNSDHALRVLAEALALAEPGGFIRIFVDEGIPMARLLARALSQGILPDYVGRILAAFPQAEAEKARDRGLHVDQAGLIEPLSERELDVLRLLAEGLSNSEIGTRLYLSPNTVKAHTRNIYGKLDVHNRTQATARARELGLVSGNPSPHNRKTQ